MKLDDQLDGCGCAPDEEESFTAHPGEPHLRMAPTSHGDAFERLTEALSTTTVPDGPNAGTAPLSALTTRDPHDPTIALLDAASCVLDILSFYHEQLGNEHYLRTAKELESLRLLAHGVGYAPAPAVSASTTLAFTVRKGSDGSGSAEVPAGTQVTNLPTDGSVPVVFETSADLSATYEKNALRPRQVRRFAFATDSTVEDEDGDTIYVARLLGTGLRIREGMKLLIHESATSWDVWSIKAVEEDLANNQTILELDSAVTMPDGSKPTSSAKAYVLRSVLQPFGAAAPQWTAMPSRWRKDYSPTHWDESDWPNFDTSIFAATTTDGVTTYSAVMVPENQGIVAGSWVYLYDADGKEGLMRLGTVRHKQKVGFAMTQRCSSGRISGIWRQQFKTDDVTTPCAAITGDPNATFNSRRDLTFYGESQIVTLGYVTDDSALTAVSTLKLDSLVQGLEDKTKFLLSDGAASELVVARKVTTSADGTYTILKLKAAIENTYDRQAAVLYGNLVQATHGERVSEVLGSGDATTPNPSFTLSNTPLTYLPSKDGTGHRSTLKVTVGQVPWAEVDTFFGAPPHLHAYTLTQRFDGTPEVAFGDGRHGARTPTGNGNLVARYRKGGGVGGNVAAGALTQLRSMPPGVSGVTNPLVGAGGADGDRAADLRRLVPRTTVSLGHLVSLSDYRDFVLGFPGLGAAHVQSLTFHNHHALLVSVLDTEGLPFAADADVLTGLVAALRRRGDPRVGLHVLNGVRLPFYVRAKLRVAAGHAFSAVEAAAQAALDRAFGWGGLGFVEPVTGSELIRVLHRVRGVVAVDLDRLTRSAVGQVHRGNASILVAREGRVRRRDLSLLPAQMLALEEATLVEMHR